MGVWLSKCFRRLGNGVSLLECLGNGGNGFGSGEEGELTGKYAAYIDIPLSLTARQITMVKMPLVSSSASFSEAG
jgi:hypothetical protein